MEFTKGKWEVIRAVECGKGGKHIGYSVTSAGTGIGDNGTIARCINPAKDMPENKANANLIAASPKLFKACELALEFFIEYDIKNKVISGLSLQLKEALTKAEGG